MNNKVVSYLLSSFVAVCSLTSFPANASTPDDFHEENFADCIKLDDYKWLSAGNTDYEAVYMKPSKTSGATFYFVSRQPDIIDFTVPVGTNVFDIAEKINKIDEYLILDTNRLDSDGSYYLYITKKSPNGGYDRISRKTVKELYSSLGDIVQSFNFRLDAYGYTYSVYNYMTAYDSFDYDFSIEESIAEYIKNNNIMADVVKYSEGDIDIYGNEILNDIVYVIPSDEITQFQHFELAKNIAESTGIHPYGVTPEGADNNVTGGKIVDVANSVKGDANCDGSTTLSDAVAVLQFLGNADKYPLTEQGAFNADIDGDGVTGYDALLIQMNDAGLSPW